MRTVATRIIRITQAGYEAARRIAAREQRGLAVTIERALLAAEAQHDNGVAGVVADVLRQDRAT